jgi:hypothetical protein
MKTILIYTLTIFAFLSCNKDNQYFQYDKLEYYHIVIDEDKVFALEESKGKKQIKLLELLQSDTPDTLSEISILNGIEKIGYKKKEISTNNFESINKIFSEKIGFGINEEMSCIAIYRDILVFKNNNKIVGVAKLCFDCQQFVIAGTNKNVENFGESGDFNELYNILNP